MGDKSLEQLKALAIAVGYTKACDDVTKLIRDQMIAAQEDATLEEMHLSANISRAVLALSRKATKGV